MLQLRAELAALIEWEAEDFPCVTQTEIDAVVHRIVRMAELLKAERARSQSELDGPRSSPAR